MRKLVYNIYCYISIIWNLQQVSGVFQLYFFLHTLGALFTRLFSTHVINFYTIYSTCFRCSYTIFFKHVLSFHCDLERSIQFLRDSWTSIKTNFHLDFIFSAIFSKIWIVHRHSHNRFHYNNTSHGWR